MRVLVACEFSGIVRDAFIRRGHDAWSCDLLDTERPGPHYQRDVREVLAMGWELVIAHPPCTHLSSSGAKHWAAKRLDGRQQVGIDFFLMFTRLPCRWCIENPVGAMSTAYRKPDQIIQPWMFGHDASKATCLWLSDLPALRPTSILEPSRYGCKCGNKFEYALGKYGCPNCCGGYGSAKPIYANQTPSGQNNLPPSGSRAHERSRTYTGIADAMAEQWGGAGMRDMDCRG